MVQPPVSIMSVGSGPVNCGGCVVVLMVVLATLALLLAAEEVLVLVVSIGVTLLDLLLAFDVFAAF